MISNDLLSVIPVLLTISMALLLRKTLVALGLGILSAALILHWGEPLQAAAYIFENAAGQLIQGGALKMWHLNVMATIALLGVLTQLLYQSGAVEQFALSLHQRIKSGRQARLAIIALGWLLFIDGIFSCLANGNVSRPLAKRYGISSPQLAYLVDSTASPLCAILPFSSWGPYVMTLLAGIAFLPVTPLSAFLSIASTNFYAIATLVIAFLVAWTGWRFTPVEAEVSNGEPEINASVWPLGLPITIITLGSLLLALANGYLSTNESGVLAWFAAADIGAAMRNACLVAVLVAMRPYLKLGIGGLDKILFHGLMKVAPALAILMMTWMIGTVIGDLKTGKVMAQWAAEFLSPQLLLPGMFLLCAVTAFATGSSWGTFALMIPIGAEIAWQLNPELLLVALSAVMAGSVFGDHCSPISDTTVLAATSSGCQPVEHVQTQLPLAITGALVALIGFSTVNLLH